MEESKQVSIQSLLENLCKSVYKDLISSNIIAHRASTTNGDQIHDSSNNIPEKLLKKCKLRAYEIILKKSQQKSPDEGYADVINPIRELRFNQFEYNIYVGQMRPHFHAYGQIKEKQQQKILKKYYLFEECIKYVEEHDYFRNEKNDGYLILWFLVLLKNNFSIDLKEDSEFNESYFSLNVKELPKFPMLKPKLFHLNWHSDVVLHENPYCNSMRRFDRDFNSHKNLEDIFDLNECQKQTAANSIKSVLNAIKKQQTSKTVIYMSNKWEELGKCYTFDGLHDNAKLASLFEKKFCSELATASLNLLAIKDSRNGNCTEALIVEKTEFIEHIKLLLIGVESESFTYDQQEKCFKIIKPLAVENLMPCTINNFMSDFLECGTCFRKLKRLITNNIDGTQPKCAGFLIKALHGCLDKYLEMFRRSVIIKKQETVAQLMLRTFTLVQQVRSLAKLLAVHPTDIKNGVPHGSEFLGYLYGAIIGVTQKEILLLLVFILTECCGVYFRHFSSWIYHGIIDDPGQELFIEFMNYNVPKTKFFFDKAFILKRQSVPGFLKGWENMILLCGKYCNLLKLYNPTHHLFTVNPPQIAVCLSFNQLKELQFECEKYKISVQSMCGAPFSLREFRNSQREKAAKRIESIALMSTKNIEEWKLKQQQVAAEKFEQKEKNRLALLQQIRECQEEKISKRRANLELDREYLRQREEADLKLLERENEQRQKNIAYYAELAQIVDAQKQRTENEIAALKETNFRDENNKPSTPQTIHNESINESDNDSIYFDAEVSSKSKASDEMLQPNDDSVMSKSDLFNANTSLTKELLSDRIRNKSNVLTSQINFAESNETISKKNLVSDNQLTEGQKNKLKVLRQEFSLIDDNANAEEPISTTELTELQKNRKKVLASEFGITEVIVNLPTAKHCEITEFEKNKKLAQRHGHSFEPIEDVNANKPLSDLELNRQKVLVEEYQLIKKINTKSTDLPTTQKKLRASLSLDLNAENVNETNLLSVKPCQSDFIVSPMSTTSDHLLDSCSDDLNLIRNLDQNTDLKLDGSLAIKKDHNIDQSTNETDKHRKEPSSDVNTPKTLDKHGDFGASSKPTFSQLLRPTFTSTNIFDLSPHLTSGQNEKSAATLAKSQASKAPSMKSLQELNSANLTYFLEQSFTIPLQVQSLILNNEILKIFFVDLDILSHFNSLRNYFFMMDGEFACNISDGILNKLQTVRKPRELYSSHALHSILENALQSSLMGNDKNAENLSFCIPNVPENFDMASPNVLSDLHLSYKVNWPLNLLISEEIINQYDRVFQHLVKLRRITWLLDECFYKLKDIRKQSAEKIQQSPQFRHVQHIRHKLLCFVNAFQNHITSVALEGSWQIFMENLDSVKSMQDLYIKHTKYLKHVKFLCMLNRSSQEFYSRMEDIFVVILRFCYNLQLKNWRCDDFGVYTHPKYEKLQLIENDFTSLIKFIIYAGKKMSKCGYQTEISEFVYMINVNGYYD